MFIRIFLFFAALNLFQTAWSQAIYSEAQLRDSQKKIVYEYKNGEAIFYLEEAGSITNLSKVKIANPLKQFTKFDYEVDLKKNVCKVTNAIYDVNDKLVSFFEMSILLFFPIMIVADAAVGTGYLVAFPSDWLSDDHKAYRKIKKLMKGKNSKVNNKTFTKMIDIASGFNNWQEPDETYWRERFCDKYY
ncbi:MAG: hypothetical protein JNM93_01505 [Bacteriovoracaceae bacterium]|nr:hypothetical protein [Bacteriovoracaceae bacterium]